MRVFFAILLGLVFFLAAILSVPLSNHCKHKSCKDMNRFWRWRLLSIVTLLVGVTLAGSAFVIIPRILNW